MKSLNPNNGKVLSSSFALLAMVSHVRVDAYFCGSLAMRWPVDHRIAEDDVGFLARFWHPVWATKTK
jgi:hypothetical protein